MNRVQAIGLDHLVLRVADPERSLTWYAERLGLEPMRVEEWRRGEVLFPSLRVDATTIIDLLQDPPLGVNLDHLCVVVEAVDLEAVAASGAFEVLGGPAELWGARGQGTGLYVRDPDGNTIELRTYPI